MYNSINLYFIPSILISYHHKILFLSVISEKIARIFFIFYCAGAMQNDAGLRGREDEEGVVRGGSCFWQTTFNAINTLMGTYFCVYCFLCVLLFVCIAFCVV